MDWLNLCLGVLGWIVLITYLTTLCILRFGMKIKRDFKIEREMEDRLPKWYRYTKNILVLISLVGVVFFNVGIDFFLIVIFGHQIMISKKMLRESEDKKQKYYTYTTFIFTIVVEIILVIGVIQLLIPSY